MNWKKLLADRRVAAEPVSREEVANLRALARRNLKDSAVEDLSYDGRLDRAYSAACTLATIVIRAVGYRAKHPVHHNTFLALEVADKSAFADFARYFETVRSIHHEVNYDTAYVVTKVQVEEVIEQTKAFESLVDDWLARNHPTLV